jgi:hypothetical protein
MALSPQSTTRSFNYERPLRSQTVVFVVLLLSLLGTAMFKSCEYLPNLDSRIEFYSQPTLRSPNTHRYQDILIPNFKIHSSCVEFKSSAEYNPTNDGGELSDALGRFNVKEDSWELRPKHGSESFALELSFQILECPPKYMASSFHLQSSSDQAIFTGYVGPRYKTEEGCGHYNASVPIYSSSISNIEKNSSKDKKCGDSLLTSHSVAVELFWTSEYRNHPNGIGDVETAFQVFEKKDNLTAEQIAEMIGEHRIKFLTQHLESLSGFPAVLELPSDVVTELQTQNNKPNCSDVSIHEWLPVGVVPPNTDYDYWHFQSHRCNYRTYTREELQYWLAGLRIRYLADSHGQNQNSLLFQLVCPEANNPTQFFDDNYACPQQPDNTFVYGWRFYRALLENGIDHDGLSFHMRQGQKEACTNMLGVGFHNVTIITTPTWLFVYETQEGLHEYLSSLRNIIELCKRIYPAEMEQMIILLQSPIAGNVFPDNSKSPADNWRGNINFRVEAFTHAMYKELTGVTDGIIPVFEWTLARHWIYPTLDGIHPTGEYYSEIFHVQTMAILSAMKKRGWSVPRMSQHDDMVRWFADVPLE